MKSEIYWSLLIEPGFVQAALWTIDSDTTRVLAIGPVTSWDTQEDLINATDASISEASAQYHGEEEASKTVFGVPPSWVSEGVIKKEFLEKLKDVCSKLSLEPTGFVVLPEAIAHYIKSEEGSPLNGIVIGVGTTFLDIAVFKLGNLMGMVNVGRSTSVLDDVVEGLTRFGATEALPSRILLYNGKTNELEEVRQVLIQADWTDELSDKIKFLHTPAVETIDPERKTVAVSLAGASEIGNVSKVTFPKDKVLVQPEQVGSEEEEQEETESDEADVTAFVQRISPEDIGFVMNKDISTPADEVVEEANVVEAEAMPEDIVQTLHHPHKKSIAPKVSPLAPILAKLKSFKMPALPKHTHPQTPAHVPHPPQPTKHLAHPVIPSSGKKSPLMMFGIVLVLLVIVGFLAWWFLPKAEVTVFIAPRQLENRQTITLDRNANAVDTSSRTIPAYQREITVSGEKTTETTGKKTVGEKAKGSVSIRNGTGVAIKVNAGTVLVGANDLKFTVDSSASVSAALSPSTPGAASVAVTAENIGAEYNLAKDETFRVGNYPKSEVDAIVEEDLTGGSSRDIVAVAQADHKKVEEELTAELSDQGRVQFESETAVDEIFIPQSISSESLNKQFSNKVGDEASTVRLSLDMKLTGLVVKRSDLNQVAFELLKDQVPTGFVLREEQINTQFFPKDTGDDGVWEFDTQFSANLLPEVLPDDIAKRISGKSPTAAQQALASIPGFVRAQIKLQPTLPGMLAVVPRVTKNISIEIAAE